MGTAIVTGASSGLGREIARKLDASGHRVVLVARSRDALDSLAATLRNALVVAADLASPGGPQVVKAAVGDADILVNNAGFGDVGDFATSDLTKASEMIQVNCLALSELTGLYLPGMLERGRGQILNVASTASFQPIPAMAIYGATKAFVLSFSEAVAEEVHGTGVTVTAFCPGAFTSGFQKTAGNESTRLVKGRNLPTSEQMATAAIDAMHRGAVISVPGFVNRAGAASVRFVPRVLVRRIAKRVNAEA